MNKLIDEGQLEKVDDPYVLMRLLRGSIGKSAHFLEQGTTDFKTLKNKRGIAQNDLKGPTRFRFLTVVSCCATFGRAA